MDRTERRKEVVMDSERLRKQLDFIVEIDKLKSVFRKTLLMDASRYEDDAEHSWHICVMAVLLAEYSAERIDILRVVKMLLIHDLVEIYAGDTFCYDDKAALDKSEREKNGADRVFGLLPADQAGGIRALWDEFEARISPEAKFAAALDRLQPILHNFHTQGAAWRKHGVTSDKVLARNRHIGEGAPALWAYAEGIIREAISKGYLPEGTHAL
jgi:putative hydrolase of HD superfamily